MAITPKYQAYLYSDKWKAKRHKVLHRAKYKCERCKKKQATQIHHLTYKRIFNERLSDLQAVCSSCHMRIHSIRTPKKVSVFGRVLARMIR